MRQGMRRGGFTLVELLVTVAILGVLMSAVAAIVIAQSRAYELNARTRDVVAANRTSVAFLESRLRLAGFGVDPQAAFDFTAGVTRDRTDGPDELAFFARDPGFHRRTVGYDPTSTTLTLDTPLTSPLYPGQVLLVTCPGGVGFGYATVNARAAGSTVDLMPEDGAFPRQTLPSCAAEQPFVLKVDRYRFFVADVREGGVVRPYLLLDQGLQLDGAGRGYDGATRRMTLATDPTPGDGADVLTAEELAHVSPLAVGVEDFQVAYVMAQPGNGWFSPALGPVDGAAGNWVLGDNASDTLRQPDPAATPPAYTDDYRNKNRFTAHPANIRGVRVTLVTRSENPGAIRNRRPAAENREAAASFDTLYRNVITTQVYVRNLLSRSNFAPVVREDAMVAAP